MALRAGYYGIKRGLKAKLADIAGTWDQTVASIFPRSEAAILGAKNLWKSTESFNFSMPSARTHSFLASNTIGAGDYTVSFTVSSSTAGSKLFSVRVIYDNNAESTARSYTIADGVYSFALNVPAGRSIKSIYVNMNSEETTGAFTLSKIMVTLGTDTDTTYANYALTNYELTKSAADQKTAINAIITAATGAADFAAFKTAMSAITPLTRSIYVEGTTEPDSRSIEEPIVEKKTTTRKKSTAKAETTEEV
jgi:hypothetical protein